MKPPQVIELEDAWKVMKIAKWAATRPPVTSHKDHIWITKKCGVGSTIIGSAYHYLVAAVNDALKNQFNTLTPDQQSQIKEICNG